MKFDVIEKKQGQSYQRTIHRLVDVLILSILLQEGKMGIGIFYYPTPSITQSQKIGLPFISELIILMIIAVFMVGFLRGKLRLWGKRLNRSRKLFLILLYFALLIIPLSFLLGFSWRDGGFGAFRMIIEALMLYMVVSAITWGRADLDRIIFLFVFVALIHAMIVVVSFFFESIIPFSVNIIPAYPYKRYAGIFLQPSRIALLFAMGWVMAFSKVYLSKFSKGQTFYLLSVLLLLLALILTQTRTYFLVIPFVILLIFIGSRTVDDKRTITRNKKTLAILIILIVVISIVLNRFHLVEILLSRFNENVSIVSTLEKSRLWIWSFALETMFRYPVGTGYASLPQLTMGEIPHAHNMYLQWGVMFGIPSLVIFIWWIIEVYKSSNRCIQKTNNVSLLILRFGWVVYILALITEPYLITNVGYWFWLIAGLLTAPCSGERLQQNRVEI